MDDSTWNFFRKETEQQTGGTHPLESRKQAISAGKTEQPSKGPHLINSRLQAILTGKTQSNQADTLTNCRA